MRRTAFKPRVPQWVQRDPDRVRSMPTVAADAWRAPRVVEAMPAAQVSKAAPVRSEAYRRLVAMFPCKFCGIAGYSQAAHPNTGKGAGTKTDDRLCFPLCCDRPGQRGCHSLFDQGALLGKEARRAIEPAWAADTQRQIQMQGLWPKKLPFPGKED